MKGPLMKGLNPAPHSHISLPPSLPCPVELIWQRGGSISQFTQAACSFFFVLCLLLCSPFLCLHPHPPLCSLCVCYFSLCLCARWLFYSISIGWCDTISYSKGEKQSNPVRLATPASCKLCIWDVMAQVSSPTLTCACVPSFIVQAVTCLPLLSVLVSILCLYCGFEQREENVLIVLHDWVPSSHPSLHNTHRQTLMSCEHPFWVPMYIRLSCTPGKEENIL